MANTDHVVRPPAACEIPLTQGLVALVEEADLALVARYQWSATPRRSTHSERWYASAYVLGSGSKNRRHIYMHRLIMGFPALGVDHHNGDTLDNRRWNLRIATVGQNQANQRARRGVSGFKGVAWEKKRKVWQVHIKVGGRQKSLGTFADEVAAAKAYDVAARRAFGDFAKLNYPDPEPWTLLLIKPLPLEIRARMDQRRRGTRNG